MKYNTENNKPRLFVDMDGTLAEWRNIVIDIENYEEIYDVNEEINKLLTQPGYFYSLRPHINVVQAIRDIIKENNIEVYILSCHIPVNRKYFPLYEKNKWLDKYLPEIDEEHRIFVPDGEDKKRYVPNGVKKEDYLLDDYTNNLSKWEMSGTGIKLLNDVNSSKGTWSGNQINFENDSKTIKVALNQIILSKEMIKNNNPPKSINNFDYNNFNFQESLKELEQETELEKD